MANTYFPRQDISEGEKDFKWCKQNISYGVDLFLRRGRRANQNIQRNYNSYLGVSDKARSNYLTNTYGKRNIGNFVSYRLSKTKIDLLVGEWLNTPLNAKVETINREAKSKKLDMLAARTGLRVAAEEVQKLRDVVGMEVMNGMEIPDEKEDLNVKSMNEKIMQIAIDYQFKKQDLKRKLSDNFLDTLISSECYGRTYIDEYGDVIYENIDPRDWIGLESDNDPFLEKSPLKGYRSKMFTSDILSRFGQHLSKEQREEIFHMQGDMTSYYNDNYRSGKYNYCHNQGGELSIDVFFVEWKSVEAVHTKIVEDKKNPNAAPFSKDLSSAFYEKNKSKIQNDVKKGKYKIATVWKEVIWEGVRIGKDMFVEPLCRKAEFQIQTKGEGVKYRADFSFSGMLFNTIDGTRVSMIELLDNVSFSFDVVMYMINRELAKLKGKVVMYDKAFLPKGEKIEDVMYKILNDSIYVVNSASDGNRFRKEVTINGQIKEIDLGISQSFQQLVNIKVTLEQTIDRLSGVNENREGMIAASSTATNAQTSIQASRAITAPLFFHMERYVENVTKKIAEKTKLAWVYKNPEQGEMIIGDSGVGFLKVTKDFVNDDYGIFIGDGQKERASREKVDAVAQVAVNGGELPTQDYLKYLMADSVGEAISVLDESWAKIKEIQGKDNEVKQQMQEQQLKQQLEIAREDREDRQAHEKEIVMLQKGLDSELATQKAQDGLVTKEAEVEMSEQQQPQQQQQPPQI